MEYFLPELGQSNQMGFMDSRGGSRNVEGNSISNKMLFYQTLQGKQVEQRATSSGQ